MKNTNQWNLSSSPAPQILADEVPGVFSHPLTSTACDSHSRSSLKLFKGEDLIESYNTVLFEGVPVLEHKGDQSADVNTGSRADSSISRSDNHTRFDVSHQALSSGYVTHETSDTISCFVEETEKITQGTESRSTDDGDLVLNSINVKNKTCEMITHIPINGEVLKDEYADPTQVPQVPREATEPVNPPEDSDSVKEPYRTSLQHLLKKSQEHRRRQRLLRNQAKALKAGGPGCASERSLSDKENELILPGRTENTMNKEMSVVERESIELIEVVGLTEQTHATKRDISLHVSSPTKRKDASSGKASSFANHQNKAESPARLSKTPVPTTAKSVYQSKSKKTGSMLPRPCLTGSKNFKNVPSPKFCLSPVHSKRGSSIPGPATKPLAKISPPVTTESVPSPIVQAKRKTVTSAGPEVSASFCRSIDQSEQIAQLEHNLSSLKVLISDLESTLTESQVYNPPESVNTSQLAEQSDTKSPSFSELIHQEVLTKDYGIQNKELDLEQSVTSFMQKMSTVEAFPAHNSLKPNVTVFPDANIQPKELKFASCEINEESENTEESLNGSSLNRSYDVETPSGLWSQLGPKGKQLTPELEGQEGVSRAKRRLLMNVGDEKTLVRHGEEKHQFSTPRGL